MLVMKIIYISEILKFSYPTTHSQHAFNILQRIYPNFYVEYISLLTRCVLETEGFFDDAITKTIRGSLCLSTRSHSEIPSNTEVGEVTTRS